MKVERKKTLTLLFTWFLIYIILNR